jgi:flagella basal body P-ring formation protein FlgA
VANAVTPCRIFALLGTLVLIAALPAGAQTAQPATHLAAQSPTAPVGVKRRIAVAAHQIARGATLTADDIEFRDSTMRSGAPADTNEVARGWVTRRIINAGELLRAPAVEPPNLVTANQSVEVEWNDGNIHLSLRGIATRNAPIGSRVTVRMESGRRVDGTVVAAGRVRID